MPEQIVTPIIGGMNTTAISPAASAVQPEATPPERGTGGRRADRRGFTGWLAGRRRRRSELLAKAASPAMLASAWSRVRRNAGVAGGDGLSCRAFERDTRGRLARLRRDLLSGDYAPGPVRRVEIVKETSSPSSLN